MAKGWKSLSHRAEIIQRLESIYMEDRKRPKNQRFNAWFDGLLDELVEHNENLKEYGAYLEAEITDDNYVLLMDNLKRKHVFVNICWNGKALNCEEDAATDCIHVGFCLALPKVYKILLGKGFRPPVFEEKKDKESDISKLWSSVRQKRAKEHFDIAIDRKLLENKIKTKRLLKQLLSKYFSESVKESNKSHLDKLALFYAMARPGEEIPERVQDTQEMEDTMAKFEDDVERLVKNATAKEKELQQQQKQVEQQLDGE
jgi:hypothetical protein